MNEGSRIFRYSLTSILHSVLNLKALVGGFYQEKDLVGAFSRIVKSSRIFVMQVVVELLSYHNTATQEEVAAVTRLADTEAGTLEAQQLAK